MTREVTARYHDPVDEIWLACAQRLGFRVVRSGDAYASTDGQGTLIIGEPATLDADDCLAQMILHELCHALVEGDQAMAARDWGLHNEDDRDLAREHACLRLQAHLCDVHGLRAVLAPTTQWRPFYDALGADPFAAAASEGGRHEPSAVAARQALVRSRRPRWQDALATALTATAAIAEAAAPTSAADSLWRRFQGRPERHALGHALRRNDVRCGDCAWRVQGGRCSVAGRQVPPGTAGCVSFEPAGSLDCQSCAACCRQAYDVVDIARGEPVRERHPRLVTFGKRGRAQLLRPGGNCVALATLAPARWGCTIYDDRPRSCRDFSMAGTNCLDARRRVGLSV
jgi:hypothetical protein